MFFAGFPKTNLYFNTTFFYKRNDDNLCKIKIKTKLGKIYNMQLV